MKAINIKLATFSFAAMLLASCSDSNNILENGGTSPIKTVVVLLSPPQLMRKNWQAALQTIR